MPKPCVSEVTEKERQYLDKKRSKLKMMPWLLTGLLGRCFCPHWQKKNKIGGWASGWREEIISKHIGLWLHTCSELTVCIVVLLFTLFQCRDSPQSAEICSVVVQMNETTWLLDFTYIWMSSTICYQVFVLFAIFKKHQILFQLNN